MSDDAPQVEYLGPEHSTPTRSPGRKRALVGVAAFAVVAVGGAGAWGVTQFLSSGDAAATAVPSDALAYVSLDLDPSGGQKVEALRTLRKFPALKEKLGVGSGDDLRKVLFEALTDEEPCPGLDFDEDIDPWLGSRIGIAVRPGDGEPVPFGVVQVTGEDEARTGIARLSECDEGTEPGTAFVGDYLVIAETDTIAEDVAADAQEASLADDGDFERWVDEAGGAGIVTGYVAADAPQAFLDAMDTAGMGSDMGLDDRQLDALLEDFQGAAVVLRFDDASVEVEVAASQVGDAVQPADGNSGLGDLPSTTAVAFGLAVADDAVDGLLDMMAESGGQDEVDEMVDELESATGLTPDDLQTLLGDGFSVALDSSVDLEGLFTGAAAPDTLPVGLRIVGDPDEIVPVLDKAIAAAGAAGQLVVETGDGVVAVGLDQHYVASLVEDGGLAEEDAFKRALPDFDTTNGIYVDFDAGDWLTGLVESDPASAETRANVEPLSSLGISGTEDDGVLHGLVRLTTD